VIDPTKHLVLQIVQTDTATGKQTQGTWGEGAEVVPATDVLTIASALKGQKVGSRVLAVTALGDPLRSAQRMAYDMVDRIDFEGMQFRKDIGHRALRDPAGALRDPAGALKKG